MKSALTFLSSSVFSSIPYSLNHQNLQPAVSACISPASSSPTAVSFTSLENNSFTLRQANNTLLIDPWLEQDLVFLTPSFFRKSKPQHNPTLDYRAFDISTVDAILITQGLADHAHPPTLAVLPKHIPIIAPISAIPLLRSLSFTNITCLSYGQSTSPIPTAPNIHVKAYCGSMVGPPWSDPQLAYVISFPGSTRPLVIYHEPHGNHDPDFLNDWKGKVDAVIAPVVSTTIPALANYSLVNGIPEALALCRAVNPRTCVAFDNSQGPQSGLLSYFIKADGNASTFTRQVAANQQLAGMNVVQTPRSMASVVIADDDV